MNPPRISVVMPCHNNAAHITEAIASVRAQTVAPAQIIVVDDGSTDTSLAALAVFGDALHLIRQPNRGAAAARNRGVAAATGSLIAFLDADDVWPADSLARRLALLTASGADMVFGAVRQCLGSAGPEAPSPISVQPGRLAGAMLIRRDAFARVGPFDESLRTAETIDWVARAQEAGLHEAACAAIVLYRRIHSTNLMRRAQDTDHNVLAVLRAAVARRRRADA
jgi:glycosyltransferase involved in cell wall biosynthesis